MEERGTIRRSRNSGGSESPHRGLHDSDHYDGSETAHALLRLGMLLPKALLVFALHAATVTSTLIVWSVVRLLAAPPHPSYRRVYQITSRATYGLLLSSALAGLLVWLLLPEDMRQVFASHLRSLLSHPLVQFPEPSIDLPDQGAPRSTLAQGIIWLPCLAVPGLLTYSSILHRHLQQPFSGVAGFGLALGTAIPAILVGMYLPLAIVLIARDWLHSHPGELRSVLLWLLSGSLFAFVFCLAGAFLVALVLGLLSAVLFRHEETSFIQIYRVGFLVLISHLFLTLASLVALSGPAQTLRHVVAFSHFPETYTNLWSYAAVARDDLLQWLLLAQVPGLLIAAGIVSAMIGGPYKGPLGFLRACIVTPIGIWTAIATLMAFLFISEPLWDNHSSSGGNMPTLTYLRRA